jgi:hypothetical protein
VTDQGTSLQTSENEIENQNPLDTLEKDLVFFGALNNQPKKIKLKLNSLIGLYALCPLSLQKLFGIAIEANKIKI